MRIRFKILLFSFFILGTNPIHGQIDWNSPILELNEKDGLPGNYIKSIVEDSYGFTWIATFAGICRFDGIELRRIQNEILPLDGYTDLIFDENRNILWIATLDGLYAYNITDESTKRYGLGEKMKNDIVAIDKSASDTIWIGTMMGFYFLDIKSDSVHKPNFAIENAKSSIYKCIDALDVIQDRINPNFVWVLSTCGVLKYNIERNEFKNVDAEIGNEQNAKFNEICYDPVGQQYVLGVGSLTVDSYKKNYLIINAHTGKLKENLHFDSKAANRSIAIARNGDFILSLESGAFIYHPETGEVIKKYTNDENKQARYQVEYVDSKDRIWAIDDISLKAYRHGDEHGRVYYYPTKNPNWYHIVSSSRFNAEQNTIFLPVFGGEGLYEFDLGKEEWKIYYSIDSKTGHTKKANVADAYYTNNRQIELLQGNGIYQVENDEIAKVGRTMRVGRQWHTSHKDQYDVFWGLTTKGLIRYDLKTDSFDRINDQVHFCKELAGELKIFEDSQTNIWISGMCGGFDVFHRASNKFYSFELEANSNCSTMTDFAEHEGSIWAVGDYGNLYEVNMNAPEKGILKMINLERLISKDKLKLINIGSPEIPFCNGVEIDALDRFWILSKYGMYLFDEKEMKLELFDKSLGLPYEDPEIQIFVGNNLNSLPNGEMYYATRKAIVLFDPLKISSSREIPTPIVTAISVNNNNVSADSSVFLKKNYAFNSSENFVGIDFSAITTDRNENLQFEYQLTGEDQDWKNPKEKRYASYSNLKGGAYTFYLRARTVHGDWNKTPLQLNFKIAKRWYETWIARIGFVIALTGILVAFYFSRIKRAVEKEKLKTEYTRDLAELKMKALTAQMNPHFIFNSLNSIDYYIIKNDTLNASQYLNRFSRLMRLILKNSTSNFVTLKDDLDALQLYLEIEALRFDKKFSFQINIDPDIDPDYTQIPPMLIQPYVENSIWHGLLHKKENGKISVNAKLGELQDKLIIEVIDNGIGRIESMSSKKLSGNVNGRKSFGMNITKDKIATLNLLHEIEAKVDIIDLMNTNQESEGTKVKITLPI